MPQVYKRKTDRAWRSPPDVLKRAAEVVKAGSSIRKASADFNVDKMTLHRYLRKCQENPQPLVGYAAVTFSNRIMSSAMELDLANYIKALADVFHGVSLEKCKQLTNNRSKSESHCLCFAIIYSYSARMHS